MVDKIVILDFGSQVTHLIARRIRQLNVYSEIIDPNSPVSSVKDAKGIIFSGSPFSVYEKQAPKFNSKILDLDLPILGICYGHQLMAYKGNGRVKPGKTKEYGKAVLEKKVQTPILKGLKQKEIVWMSHGDTVIKPATGFEIVASTNDCECAIVANEKKKRYGLQFHPEVTHTENGLKILKNFVIDICKAKANWNIHNYISQKGKEIKKQVGEKNVFVLVSGGVDSVVTLAFLSKTLGKKRVYALHVDTGFMRKNESAEVEKELMKLGLSELHVLNAEKEFFDAVKGVADPEKKRNIIGTLFVKVANRELRKLKLDPKKWLLGQGTIYPDTIESSGTKYSSKIKTHHNRIDSLAEMVKQGLVVEPINQLYKDEVRKLGHELGLSNKLIYRHPFPGPGLAIRCLCSKTNKKPNLKKTEIKAKKLLKKHDLTGLVLPIKSTGVQGDARTYRHPLAIIGNDSWIKFEKISTQLTNELNEINRVVWTVYPKEIKKVELKKSYMTPERVDILREADFVVHKVLNKHKYYNKIWQFPIILIPISINGKGESIVLRPVASLEAMTAKFAELPKKIVQEMKKELLKIKGINAVFYDVTHKPPATICWE